MMETAARDAMAPDQIEAIADKGYYKSDEILACEQTGITIVVPKPQTSNAGAPGDSSTKLICLRRKGQRLHLPGRQGTDLSVHWPARRQSDRRLNGRGFAKQLRLRTPFQLSYWILCVNSHGYLCNKALQTQNTWFNSSDEGFKPN